ncbi:MULTISPECIES: cation diffusion facilitator family transporter [unclassified Colwellia]|uniref:cation diffusion facilitator family transporter n=1 Tax=unclassified Colwellia TaxID=196834 RepID=UPI0015F5A8CA|nr:MULTISPECIES: cation diffusion facilitator family transporter [unclassified Colwellia]MBA6234330.1 cation diffusion facilitator family transporter [Colwellia sp. MB02u-7]MBA6237498.1 cation diffusion facilitator family transporter [Colwellia sp. MB02u-11]MBA6300130.1 cation diffusion facilitator family transporter [Colwellia sp. MB3u-22]MBA6312240.1 cation diffusion facilitator family transporter [Colwellia sp. MB3u-64]
MSKALAKNDDYGYWVKIAAFAATATALLLVVLKLYAWLATDASSMLASATDSMLDLFASLMNVVIIHYALAPADEKHKFGHGKAESLAGLVQAAFVTGSALLLVFHGFDRIINPKPVVKTEIGIIVTIIAIVMTLLLVLLQRFVIKKTRSVAISADALHYQSDLLLNLGVLAALILSSGYSQYADGAFTCAVGLLLLSGALKIIYLSVHNLMDHELSEDELTQITAIVLSHDSTLGVHDLRTRQSGPHRFIQFHLELDDRLSLLAAHSIGEAIEKEIEAKFSPCEVFIHHDPTSIVER